MLSIQVKSPEWEGFLFLKAIAAVPRNSIDVLDRCADEL